VEKDRQLDWQSSELPRFRRDRKICTCGYVKRVELNKNDILKVDCVFEGETEFPKSYYDPEKEEKADA
jgi:hypothetical protein